MIDKATQVNISLYQSQISTIEEHLNETNRFKSVSAFFQHLVHIYFNRSKWDTAKMVMLLIVYPMLIMVMMLYIIKNTQDVNSILLENKILTDLLFHSQIYSVISFGFMGIMIAGFIFIIYVRRKE